MHLSLRCVFAVIALATIGLGQEPIHPPARTLEELEVQLRDLQQQVKVLQGRLEQISTPAVETAGTVAPGPSESEENHGIQIHGFGEVNYKVLNQRTPELGSGGFVPGSAGNFYTGNFDLLLTARLTNKANVLGEINFSEKDAQHFDVDVERLLLNYNFNDWLRISVGRYQTAIGYYNNVYHTGAWPQTTADRPLIMEYPGNGGILPVQAIGVSFRGSLPSGKLGLHYLLEYGSSDTIRSALDGSGTFDDENNGNQVNLGLFARPDWLPGLEAGGSFYHDKISDDRTFSIRYDQTIVNGHVVYAAHGWEFLNEGVLVRHAQESASTGFNMPGFYTQFSKEIGHVRPYFRFQYVNTNPRSALHDVLLRYGPSLGARYDFNSNIAFKLQFDHTVRKSLPNLSGLQTQLAFTF